VERRAYLRRQRQHFRAVVERVAQPQKPFVPGHRSQPSNCKCSCCPCPVSLLSPDLYPSSLFYLLLVHRLLFRTQRSSQTLRDQISYKVYNEGADELRRVRSSSLDTSISAEGFVYGFQPEPGGSGDRLRALRRFLSDWRLGSIPSSHNSRRCSPRTKLRGVSEDARCSAIRGGRAPQGRGARSGYHDTRTWCSMCAVKWGRAGERSSQAVEVKC